MAKEGFRRLCRDLAAPLLQPHTLDQAGARDQASPGGSERPYGQCGLEPRPTLSRERKELEVEFLATPSWKDTEDQGDEGDGSQHTAQVGHHQVQGGGGPMVGEGTVQADKEQPCREGHTSSHVVQRLGMVHLTRQRPIMRVPPRPLMTEPRRLCQGAISPALFFETGSC